MTMNCPFKGIKLPKTKRDKEASKCFREFKHNEDEKEEIFYVAWMTLVWNSKDFSKLYELEAGDLDRDKSM